MVYSKGRQRFLSSVPSCEIQCQNIRLRAMSYFDFISDFPIFLPKSGCSLKKKKVRKRVFEKYSRRRVPYKITSSAGGCRPLVYSNTEK